jgi:hypothetical protein
MTRVRPDGGKDNYLVGVGSLRLTEYEDDVIHALSDIGTGGMFPGSLRQIVFNRLADPAVHLALTYYGLQTPSWTTLYNVYEVLEESIGIDAIVQRGWATRRDLDTFTTSANAPLVSGRFGRHARRRGVPQRTMTRRRGVPQRTMTLEDARTLFRTILARWISE